MEFIESFSKLLYVEYFLKILNIIININKIEIIFYALTYGYF